MNINGKKILFFSPKAFGYEQFIKSRLEQMGAEVLLYDDRPSNGFWGKALLRVRPELMKKTIDRYYADIAKQIGNSYRCDFVFLLNLEAMPVWFLEFLKERFSGSTIIFYMWDSFKNKPHAHIYLKYCDKAFSFDPHDKDLYPSLDFRPLFYIPEYAFIAQTTNRKYDLSFIGTAHSDRIKIAESLRLEIEKKGGQMFNYYYLQSRKLWMYLKLSNKDFRNTKSSFFRYKPLSSSETVNIVGVSKAVLDIQHPAQTGLTMRTLEVLGAQRKLITTNETISAYDFYNPNNVLVIDRQNPVIPESFLKTKYQPIDKDLNYKYSLDGWLDEVFK